MIPRLSQILLMCVFLAACSGDLSPLENASKSYKSDRNYRSLEILNKNILKGMPRKEVERLLGEPDYSPVDGLYYYSSNHAELSKEQGREVTVGLVVDYRDKKGVVTDTLQDFRMGPIGE
jgi:hypothetical protein